MLISNRMTKAVNRMAYWNNKILSSAVFTEGQKAQSLGSMLGSLCFVLGIYGLHPVTHGAQI